MSELQPGESVLMLDATEGHHFVHGLTLRVLAAPVLRAGVDVVTVDAAEIGAAGSLILERTEVMRAGSEEVETVAARLEAAAAELRSRSAELAGTGPSEVFIRVEEREAGGFAASSTRASGVVGVGSTKMEAFASFMRQHAALTTRRYRYQFVTPTHPEPTRASRVDELLAASSAFDRYLDTLTPDDLRAIALELGWRKHADQHYPPMERWEVEDARAISYPSIPVRSDYSDWRVRSRECAVDLVTYAKNRKARP